MDFILSVLCTEIIILWNIRKLPILHKHVINLLIINLSKLFKLAKYFCGIFSFRKINLQKAIEKH